MKTSSLKSEFEAIMQFAREVESHDPRGLVELVRMCGQIILSKYLSWRIRSLEGNAIQLTCYGFLLFPMAAKLDSNGNTFYKLCPETGERPVVTLGKSVVLPWPWSRMRFAESVAFIGEGRKWGKWKVDQLNHRLELWKPLGIAWGTNGNHSMTAGILRCEGRFRAHVVRDITPLYEHVICDGANFRRKADNKKISDVRIPEFAAIYEIGRMMLHHGISA